MGIARRTSALRRGLMLQAADREAGQGRIDAALARLAKAAAGPDVETRRAALQAAARLTAAAGRAEDAAEHLRDVVRLDDADPAAWRALALHAEDMAAYPEAVYAWGRVIALTGDTAALRLRIAALVERYGDRDARIEAWEAAAIAAPDDALALDRLADLLRGDTPERAGAHLARLSQVLTGDAAARRLVEVAAHHGDFTPVLAPVRRMAEIEPTAETYRRLATLLDALDRPDEAEGAWRAVVEREPEALDGHRWLADRLEARDPARAAQHLRILAKRTREPALWGRLARLYGGLGLATAAERKRHAEALEAAGEASDAIAAWRAVAELAPDDATPHARLAALLEQAQRPDEAAPHLRKVAELLADDRKAWVRLALRAKDLNDPETELAALRQVVRITPDDAGAHKRIVQLLVADQRRTDAEPHVQALLRLTPDAIWAWSVAMDQRLAEGDSAGAVSALEQVVALDPADTAVRRRLALRLMELGQPAAALPALEALVAVEPDNLGHVDRLAEALLAMGKPKDALPHVLRVAQEFPKNAERQQQLGELLEQAGRGKAAAEGWRWLATLRSDTGDAAGALKALRALEALKPADSAVQRDLALALASTGDAEAAIAIWRALLEKKPKDAEAHGRLAALLYGERRRQEALPHLRAVVAADPTDLRSWRRIASIVADDGDVASQIAAWRDVVAADPQDIGAQEQLADLLEATDLQAALPVMEAVARLTPDKVKPWKRLGKWLQDEERIPEAIEAWSQSLAIAPDDVETHRRLAQLHLLTGDYRSGLRRLNSFAMLNEEPPPALAGLVPEPPPLAETPLVSAVILSLEGAELLEGLFSSFHAHNRYPNVELIVIDHASTDDTAAVLDRWQDRLPIRRIMRDANYSYSASCNLGVREAKGDLVLLLNNDVMFSEDVLGEMVRYLTPDVGIVGLKQFNSAPLPQEVLRPYHIGVRFAWDAGGRWFKPRHAIPTTSDQLIGVRPAYFPAVTASVMLCRKADYLALGGLDEAFIYGHEDLDFCCKMRFGDGAAKGKTIISLNNRAAFHPKNSTRRGADAETRAKQGAANEALFKSRWAKRISAEYLGLIFRDDGSYRGRAPAVAFGVPSGADDALVARAYAVGEAMVQRFGWQVRYLLEGESGWDKGQGLDGVIGLGEFPVDKVQSREPFVVRITAADQGEPVDALLPKLRAALEAGVRKPAG